MALRHIRSMNSIACRLVLNNTRTMSGGERGDGVGKGGGSGGAIRDAGGAFGKKEAAQEDEYFRRKQAEQLQAIKKHINEEIDFHQGQIKELQEDIDRHQQRLKDLDTIPK